MNIRGITTKLSLFAIAAFFVLMLSSSIFAQVAISSGTTITQNFDSIGTSATATLPTGFRADKRTVERTVGTYAAGVSATERQGGDALGPTAGNGIYNFGAGPAATATDRAIGFLASGTATKSGNLYVQLQNTGTTPITQLNLNYNVEKYRNGMNAAGFTFQLYTSTDDATYSPATGFTTSFPADADNSGFTPAPGASVPVSGTLTVNIPVNGFYYLAFNYSVTATSTTTNAQALAIDDISIAAAGGAVVTPPSFSINDVTQAEGNSGTTNFTFTVTKTGTTSSSSTVNFSTTDGTATAGSDYLTNSGTLTFAAGETTQTITVIVNGDTVVEPDETFTVNITAGTNASVGDGSGLGTITNDDAAAPAGTIEFSSATFTGSEAAGTATLTVRRTGGSNGTISATVTFTDGTAVSTGTCGSGQDYTSGSTTVNFANGDAADKTVTVTICNDTTAENAETFSATLGGSSAGGQTTATVTIADNDGGSSTVTLGNPSCQGLATPPLTAGTANRALMCFSLSANNGASFTGLTVRFNSNPAEKYTNPKLFSSTDTDYGTKGDNVFLANGTVDTTKFTFTGFASFNENAPNKTAAPELSETPTIYFVVADVLPTVNSSTQESTPAVSPEDIMTTPPTTVTGTTATSPAPITFAPAGPTAAAVDVGGRVLTAGGRGIFRAIVRLTDGAGNVRQAYTNNFGYYRFSEVEVGQTLVISVKSKGYRFGQPTQVISLTEESGAINFTAY